MFRAVFLVALLGATPAQAYVSAKDIAMMNAVGTTAGAISTCEDSGWTTYGRAYSIARLVEANVSSQVYRTFKRAYALGRKTGRVYFITLDRYLVLTCPELENFTTNFLNRM